MTSGKLLITCFEPFGGRAVNCSEKVVSLVADRICGWEVERLQLPVEFGKAGEQAIRAAEACGADIVLSVGEAAGRACITPEMVALNLRHARIPDNAGDSPSDMPVVDGGENALFSTLPARSMHAAIEAFGITSTVSYSAGTFVCNDVFYQLLNHFMNSAVRVGFIHIPADASLDALQIARALELALEACLTQKDRSEAHSL